MTNPTETSLRDAFDHLLDDEPALRVDADAAIARGRRDARHRLMVRATAAAACVATATAVLATAVHHDARPGVRTNGTAASSLARTPFRLTAQHGQVAVTQAGLAPSGPTDDAIIAAIKANSPAPWTFTFGGGGTDASTVDGTADDGAGPGRVYVYAEGPGTMTREPCSDPDFSSGVSCTETHLGGDAILSVRGLFNYEGVETYEIALTHADGSGVGAEAGNFTLRALPKFASSPSLKRELIHPDHDRLHPTYDASQLAAIVKAVDAAVHGS
jgi:hypothetical protein